MSSLSRRQLLAATAGLMGSALAQKTLGAMPPNHLTPMVGPEGSQSDHLIQAANRKGHGMFSPAGGDESTSFNPLEEKGIPLSRQLRNVAPTKSRPTPADA